MSVAVLDKIISDYNRKKSLSKYVSLVADEIEFYSKQNKFYKLPQDFIIDVIKRSSSLSSDICCNLAKNLPGIQFEILKNIELDETSNLQQIIEVISAFDGIPLLNLLKEKYSDEQQLVDRDWKFLYEETEAKYEKLNHEHELFKSISDIKDKAATFVGDMVNAHQANMYPDYISAESLEEIIAELSNKPTTVSEAQEMLDTIQRKHKIITGLETPPDGKLTILTPEQIKSLTFDQAMNKLEEAISILERTPLNGPEHDQLYQYAKDLKEYCNSLLKSGKEAIMGIARENNIPLSEIGIYD